MIKYHKGCGASFNTSVLSNGSGSKKSKIKVLVEICLPQGVGELEENLFLELAPGSGSYQQSWALLGLKLCLSNPCLLRHMIFSSCLFVPKFLFSYKATCHGELETTLIYYDLILT